MKAQKVLMWITPLPTIIGTALALYKSYNGTQNMSVPLLIVGVAVLAIIISFLIYDISFKNSEINEQNRERENLIYQITLLKEQNDTLKEDIRFLKRKETQR